MLDPRVTESEGGLAGTRIGGGNGFGGVGKAETWETHPCGISPLAASRRVSL